MIHWLVNWYDARRRQIDIDVLWPQLKELAPDLDMARAAFMYHCINDSAWSRHFLHDELVKQIEALP